MDKIILKIHGIMMFCNLMAMESEEDDHDSTYRAFDNWENSRFEQWIQNASPCTSDSNQEPLDYKAINDLQISYLLKYNHLKIEEKNKEILNTSHLLKHNGEKLKIKENKKNISQLSHKKHQILNSVLRQLFNRDKY